MTTKTTPKALDKAGDDKSTTAGAASTTPATGVVENASSNTGTTTPDTGTLSPQPKAKASPSGTLSRNDATRVMTAIDELRKRTVKELRLLSAAVKRQPDDTIKTIELGQKQRYLADLADLHKVVGEAFDLGGY